ncbi:MULTISPECIES: LacI family DNA-binding transcriptional regulator [unclassified Chelatococcus]|uniref:LacI family DNA-binding transcriptional regulator n=1 Tax=unclassified Chelatococcus TaxID=2638111 RepID=UPI001BD14A44|nr:MULTISPECIES: LacI family DNA-binding transcriptional regulator [unclassified Chelatococcus]CAH1659765.1 LacI family transcriptional regulator [Hyphomicrobiales bacterium]MBS7740985.1 LacI family DNA-binding transcriptional regulator [Chelatococcus sp. HY11]MBX3545171.1 LacI family DNA-binding transcriptional regulator [Chelatococcus sp.]MCO5077804.1 LacI family transcriptional regulator [Chelatococcus sp.]CAH1683706.1 LacI family transcriptional regulator [Hyphomicrobiales bacterium]
MVSIVDVARHARVSQATVSRVLSQKVFVTEETRQKVMSAIEELGYLPSSLGKALRTGYLDSVAFLVSDIEQGWYSALAKHLQRALQERGLDMLLFDLSHSEARLVQMLERSNSLRLRGVILATSDNFDFRSIQPITAQLKDGNIPVVSIGQKMDHLGISSVLHDEVDAGIQGVMHFVARGRTRIAYLNRISLSAAGRQRYDGYVAGLQKAGIPFDSSLLWESPLYRFEGGYAMVAQAVAAGVQFDAILAGTDELAIGALSAADDVGLNVPRDVAVMGFGGLDVGKYSRPKLTTLTGNPVAVAQEMVKMLFSNAVSCVSFKRELIVRATS